MHRVATPSPMGRTLPLVAFIVAMLLAFASACGGDDDDSSFPPPDEDNDGFGTDVDCDDADPVTYPGAPELCDDQDNDCDSQADDGVIYRDYHEDADGDTYGNPAVTANACTAPDGFLEDDTDCDDTDPSIHPGAEEVCDQVDNDCNDTADDGATTRWYLDGDGDGYGDPEVDTQSCTAPQGYVEDGTDCDDGDPSIHPDAVETCDGKDSNCNGATDEGAQPIPWYQDGDSDGYGNSSVTTVACVAPEGFVAISGDCDDTDPDAYPTATEVCDGVDNNCNSKTDEGYTPTDWYLDLDGDGYGDPDEVTSDCAAPDGTVDVDGDCDDADPDVYPDALELLCDGIDQDCDGPEDDLDDADADGFDTCPPGAPGGDDAEADCDDADADIYPGATDDPYDGVDSDCDGAGELITTAVGTGASSFGGDGGPATAAQIAEPQEVAIDVLGRLYIADYDNDRVRRVALDGTISTIAGAGEGYSGDGGPATAALLNGPRGLAFDSENNLYVTDSANYRIRRIDASGTITTYAGNGLQGHTGDGGAATDAKLGSAYRLAFDAADNLYIASSGTNRVRMVTKAGIISTVVGNGQTGYSGDGGPATAASIANPRAVAVDAEGNLYVADTSHHAIRRVDTLGIITTVVGSGTAGSTGDGGPASAALLNYPEGIAFDDQGNLLISDSSNHKVRMVNAGTGTILTVAGSGTSGYLGDGGPATLARMNQPVGIVPGRDGDLFIADRDNHRIRQVLW